VTVVHQLFVQLVFFKRN